MTMTDYTMAGPTQHERNWAAVAHLTAVLTLVIAASTAGLGHILGLLVPLAIYIYFSNRSRYVAYHALQATVFQAVAGILYVIAASLAGAMIAVAWTVAGVALTLAAGVELVGLPALALFYSAYGAYLIYKGQEFDYPVLGSLVARSVGRGSPGSF